MVYENPHSHVMEFLLESSGCQFVVEPVNNDCRNIETRFVKVVYVFNYLVIICESKISPDLPSFNVLGAYAMDNLHFFSQQFEHSNLRVKSKAWKDSRSMIVITQFSA